MTAKKLAPMTTLLGVVVLGWAGRGCDTVGAIGGVVGQAIPRYVEASYKGLAGQDVIVMAWADRGVRADFPELQLDLAAGLQNKLIGVQTDEKPDDLKKTIFPVSAAAVAELQSQHPEWELEPPTATAVRLNGTRLIFLSISEFSLHSGESPDLYLGKMTVDVKVIETTEGVDHKVTAKQAYAEQNISVQYPKDTPPDGLPIGTEHVTADGTVKAMIDELAKRFYKHEEKRN